MIFIFILNFLFQSIPSPPYYVFNNISKKEGLFNDKYNSFFFEDTRGNIWISSSNDVYCYNGHSLKSMDLNQFIRKEGNNNIQSGFIEENNTIWFSSYSELINYNLNQKKFGSYRLYSDSSSVRNSNYRLISLSDDSEFLYVSISDSIYSFNIQKKEFSKTPLCYSNSVRYSSYENTIIGSKWLNGKGVELIKNINKTENSTNNILLNHTIVQAKNHFGRNELFAITPTSLLSYNIRTTKEEVLFQDSLSIFWDFEILNSCEVLISTLNTGLIKLNICESKPLRFFDQSTSNLINNSVHDLFLDQSQNIWINHIKKGVFFINANKLKEDTYSSTLLNHQPLRFFENKNDLIVVHKNRKVQVVKAMNFSNSEKLEIIDLKEIRYAFLLEENMLVACDNHKLVYFDVESNKTINSIVSTNEIISASKLDDFIIISTSRGFYRIGSPDSLTIEKIVFDSNEHENFCSIDKVLGCLFIHDPATSELRIYEHINQNEVSYLNSHIADNFLKVISINEHVFLLYSDQILKYDVQSKTITTWLKFGTDFRISGSIAYSGEEMWLSSNLGIIKIQDDNLLCPININDINVNNFSPNATLKTDDGRLWFGTDKGLVVFHPDSIEFDFCTPRMNIEEILVNNQYIQSDTYVGDMTEATLAYDENSLAIKGIAIDCMFSPDVKSYYRFTGVDTTWKEVKNGEYLRYDRLDPGGYKLEMYALSPNLVKSEIKSIDFTINQPYWQTWWFRLLGLGAIGGLAYGAIQLYVWNRLREERQKRLQLETQQAERNRIADELHDDLGGGLSVIRFLSEELQDSAADKRTQSLVNKISSSSQQLLTSMREIIWAMDTRNDTIGQLSGQVHDYAKMYLSQHGIALQFDTGLTDNSIELTGEKRRNIYLIAKEAIHNITKHAECSEVNILMSLESSQLQLEIKDNGKGYDLDQVKPGRGTGSMQRRAQAINADLTYSSTLDVGTDVKLVYHLT